MKKIRDLGELNFISAEDVIVQPGNHITAPSMRLRDSANSFVKLNKSMDLISFNSDENVQEFKKQEKERLKEYQKFYRRNRDYIRRLNDEPEIEAIKVRRLVDSVSQSV